MPRQSFAVMRRHGGLLLKHILTLIHRHGDPSIQGSCPDTLCHPRGSGLWVQKQSSVRSGPGPLRGVSTDPGGDKGRLYVLASPFVSTLAWFTWANGEPQYKIKSL